MEANRIKWFRYSQGCLLPEYRGEFVAIVHITGSREEGYTNDIFLENNGRIKTLTKKLQDIEKVGGDAFLYIGVNNEASVKIVEEVHRGLDYADLLQDRRDVIMQNLESELFGWHHEKPSPVL